MKKFRVLGLVLCCVLLGIRSSAQEVTPGNLAANADVQGAIALVDAWIEGLQRYQGAPSISVGFVHDQELLFAKSYGYANVKRKVPASPDTIYSICSISKLFTAISVMQQRDRGRLTLRDTVQQHLPWFDLQPAHAQSGPARIHGLLTHSSGLPRESDFPYWSDLEFPFPDRKQMIERLSSQQTLYPADTRFQYSNLALTMAGEIVAQTSEQDYASYVQQEILEPLQMSQTRPSFPQKLHGREMAVGYSGFDRDRKRKVLSPFDTRAIAPAAGFTSTVRDLARFASWQFSTLAGQATILDANTLREMHRVHWVDPDWKINWGLGFSVRKSEGSAQVGHTGGCPGYITSLALIPEHNIAAIALTNAGDVPASRITDVMLRNIGRQVKKVIKDTSQATTADTALSEYSGNYKSEVWGGEVAVRVWGDQLALVSIPSTGIGDTVKLKRVEGDQFIRLDKQDIERDPVVFVRDKKGNVSGVKSHSNVRARIE